MGLGMLARHMSPGWRLVMNSRRSFEEGSGEAGGVWFGVVGCLGGKKDL